MHWINSAQFEALAHSQIDNLAVRVADWLAEQPGVGAIVTEQWCRSRIHSAAAAGITAEPDVAQWARIALCAGDDFFATPPAADILNSPHRPPELKMFQLRHLFERAGR